MTETKTKYDDDKEFVIVSVSRAEVREFCGDEIADRMSDADMERLASELAETYCGNSFLDDLEEIIADKFSDSSEDEED